VLAEIVRADSCSERAVRAPAVVSVIMRSAAGDAGKKNPSPPSEALGSVAASGDGSGVIVDARKGIVLTSHTDVSAATELTVLLLDGRLLEVQVLGSDPVTDVAVLRIEPENL
jgi:S1-C subfamily serine protease